MDKLKKIIYLDSAEQFIELYKNGTITKANGTVITYDKNNQYMIASPTYYKEVEGVSFNTNIIKVGAGTGNLGLTEISPDKVVVYDIENTGYREYKKDSIRYDTATNTFILYFPEASGTIATEEKLENYYSKQDMITISEDIIRILRDDGASAYMTSVGVQVEVPDAGSCALMPTGLSVSPEDLSGMTQYNYNGISHNGHFLTIPLKSGTLATTQDIDDKLAEAGGGVKIVRLI